MGVELTISANIAEPAGTKTTYTYSPHVGEGTGAGTIATDWEATEKITVVSIGDAGITAVDEFTSTGAAGRTKAEFTGTWNGNEGDKVICLYPAISVASRYSGVAPGLTSISVSFPAHAPSYDINSIKDYDLMIGDVSISGTNASVDMCRKISVIKLGFSCPSCYKWDSANYCYRTQFGISIESSGHVMKLLASHGTIASTKSTYTGTIVPDTYYSENRSNITYVDESGPHTYYIPILAEGSLEVGDIITFYTHETSRSGYGMPDNFDTSTSKTGPSTLPIAPGFVYAINGVTF